MKDNFVDLHIKEGILFVIANDEFYFDLKAAKYITKKRLEICNGISYPTFFDFGESSRYANLEARNYFTNEGEQNILAAAFFADNIASRAFIDSYLTIHKPRILTKIFSARESAIKWLKYYAR